MAKRTGKSKPSAPKTTAQSQQKTEQKSDVTPQNQMLDLLKRRKELESEILALKKQILTEDKNDAKEVDKINRYEISRNKHIKEYYEILEKISKLRKEQLDYEIKTQKLEKEKEKLQKEEELKIKSKEQHIEDINELQEKSLVLMRSMSEQTQKQAKQMGITISNVRTLSEEMKDANIQLSQSAEVSKSFDKSLTSVMDVARELDSIEGKMAESIQDAANGQYELMDLYETERNLKMAMAQLDLNAVKMGKDRYMALRKTLESFDAQLKRVKMINKGLAEQANLIKKVKKAEEESTSNESPEIFKRAADFLAGFFNNSMKSSINKGGSWVDTLGNKIKNAMSFSIDKIKDGVTGIFSLIYNVVSKLFSLLFSVVTDLDTRAAETSRLFGVNRQTAFEMERAFAKMAIASKLIGVNAEQFRETTAFLSDTYGLGVENLMGGAEQIGIIKNMTILRDAFKLTNDEAKNLFEYSVMTGQSMDKLAFVTDKMGKGIMQTQQALKAMANVPKLMQLNIKTGLAGLAAFASKVKLMGVDFAKIQQMQDSFLDIESSLEKQFESEVLTKIHVADMDKIRAAALYGETDRMYDLILKNIGSIEHFKSLNTVGQKAYAGQFEMTREEMVEMLTRGETLKKLGLSFQQAAKYQSKNAQELFKLSEEQKRAGNMTLANYLLNAGQQKQHATIMEKINDQIEKMKLSFAPAASRILELINKILDKLFNSPIFGKIMDFMNNAVDRFVKNLDDFLSGKISFKDLFSGVDFGLGEIFKTIFQNPAIKEFSKSLGLDNIEKGLKGIVSELGKLNEKLGIVTWLTQNWFSILGLVSALILTKFIGGTGLIKFALGVGVLTVAMHYLTDSFERLTKIDVEKLKQVGIIMGLMLGGLVALGALAAGSGGTIALGIIVIVGAFRALVGAIVALAEVTDKLKPVFDFILKGFKQVYDFIYNIVKLLADFLIESLKQVGKLIADVLYAIGNNVVNIIQQIQKYIESLVNTLKDAAVVILNTIGNVVQGIYNSIFNGILNVINGALDKVKEVTEVIKNSIVSVIESIKNAINTVADALVLVLDKVIQMIKTNPGNIERIAGAMSSISWSLLKMGGGSLLGSDSKLEDFMEIMHAAQADRIYAVADSIRYLSQTIRELNGTLNNVSINKLNAVVSRSQNTAPIQTGGGGGGFFGSLMSNVSSLWNGFTSFITGNENKQTTSRAISPQRNYSVSSTTQPKYSGGDSQSQNVNVSAREMEKKLDAIITLLTNQSKKTAQIKFGERFIEEIRVELGAISDVYANVDNPKGKFLK